MSNATNTTFSTYQYFDLFEFTTEVKEAYVAAQMATSTAWRIDTLIKQQAGSIFRQVRDKMNSGSSGTQYDSIQDLNNCLKEMEFAEASFAEAGLDNTALHDLQTLSYMRDTWHELAKELVGMTYDYKGNPRQHEIPSIDDILFEELETKNAKNIKLSQHYQARLRTQAERRAEAYDAKEMAGELYERKIQRERQNALDMNAALMDRAPAVFNIYQLAMRADVGEVSDSFQTLSIELQRILIQNAQAAAERADDFAAKERNMTDSQYDCICLCSIGVIKQLRSVLNAPKFVQSERVRNSTSKA